MSVRILGGQIANTGLIGSFGMLEIEILDGPHAGHRAILRTGKYSCGAYEEEVVCSCGRSWQNAMNGCWQWHQRPEWGDPTLKMVLNELPDVLKVDGDE